MLGGVVCNYSFHNLQYHTVSTLNIFNYPQGTHPETNTHTRSEKVLDFLPGVVTSNRVLAGSLCLLQPASYNTQSNDEGSIKEVTCCLHSRLLARQILFFPACQCQEPFKEQWWGYSVRKQCEDGSSYCFSTSHLEKCPVLPLHFWFNLGAKTSLAVVNEWH